MMSPNGQCGNSPNKDGCKTPQRTPNRIAAQQPGSSEASPFTAWVAELPEITTTSNCKFAASWPHATEPALSSTAVIDGRDQFLATPPTASRKMEKNSCEKSSMSSFENETTTFSTVVSQGQPGSSMQGLPLGSPFMRGCALEFPLAGDLSGGVTAQLEGTLASPGALSMPPMQPFSSSGLMAIPCLQNIGADGMGAVHSRQRNGQLTTPFEAQPPTVPQEQKEEEADPEPRGRKRKVCVADSQPRHRRRTLSFKDSRATTQGKAEPALQGLPQLVLPTCQGAGRPTSPLPATLPLFQPVLPICMPLQSSPMRMMEQPQVVPLQQQAPPSMGNAVAAETQGRLGSRAASSNTTGTWRTGSGEQARQAVPEVRMEPERPARKKCNCKKSRCLKLYCDCFAAGQFCSNCTCTGCNNTQEYGDAVLETRTSIKARNAQAFETKMTRNVETCDGPVAMHKRGCHCKKSGCKKKYCECFQAGVNCGSSCKCENCQNQPGDGPPQPNAPSKTPARGASSAEGKGRKSSRAQPKKSNSVATDEEVMAPSNSVSDDHMLPMGYQPASANQMPAVSQPADHASGMADLFSPAILWDTKLPVPAQGGASPDRQSLEQYSAQQAGRLMTAASLESMMDQREQGGSMPKSEQGALPNGFDPAEGYPSFGEDDCLGPEQLGPTAWTESRLDDMEGGNPTLGNLESIMMGGGNGFAISDHLMLQGEAPEVEGMMAGAFDGYPGFPGGLPDPHTGFDPSAVTSLTAGEDLTRAGAMLPMLGQRSSSGTMPLQVPRDSVRRRLIRPSMPMTGSNGFTRLTSGLTTILSPPKLR